MKTLILENITAEKQTIRYHYSVDGDCFVRGHDFDTSVSCDGFLDDPVFAKLLAYSAIADSIYTFGLSYYDEIHLPFKLDEIELKFFDNVFLKGLAEFRYVNHLPITQTVRFTWDESAKLTADGLDKEAERLHLSGAFVLNGGGKDGAVAIEMAKKLEIDLAWFTSGAAESRSRIVDASDVNTWTQAHRYSDGYVKEHAIYKGHRPMSFYVSMIASLAAYVTGRRYVIAANEYSASFPNLAVDGFWINHQYSKSSEYEESLGKLFQYSDIPVTYFSITRPLYELQIMRVFSGLTKYHEHFLSCNKGMRDDVWCMKCAKCAFVIGAMYLYNEVAGTELWGVPKEVFAAGSALVDELIELVNIDAKPLECIGTIAENRFLLLELLKRDMIALSDGQQQRISILLSAGETVEDVDFGEYDRPGFFPPELEGKVKDVIHQTMTEGAA